MMNALERRSTFALSSIFALRMLGLFMIIPVFSVVGQSYQYATPALIGLAVGVYGLSQAILQIPFSLLADRFSRKPLVVFGLLLFAIGGAIAGLSDTIYGVIIGRAIAVKKIPRILRYFSAMIILGNAKNRLMTNSGKYTKP